GDRVAHTTARAGRAGSRELIGERSKGSGHGGAQVSIGLVGGRRGGSNQVGPGAQEVTGLAGDRSQPSSNAISDDGRTDRTADGVRDSGWFGGIAWKPGYRDRPPCDP